MMVVMEPMNHINTNNIRSRREITYRPMTEIGLRKMRLWLEEETWAEVTHEESANRKAEVFQSMLLAKYEEFFPEKTCKVASDSQPFYNNRLMRLKRKKTREYRKHRKSEKWRYLKKVYDDALGDAKKKFYRNKVLKLKKADPRKWYSELKKITSYDQHESNEVSVDDIKELAAEKQVELIADKFAEVSNEYKKLEKEDIEIPSFVESEIPQFDDFEVLKVLQNMNTTKSNVRGDVPSFIYKQFADFLKKPVTNVVNAAIKQGHWPDICKIEIVTPVPKVFPTKTIDRLRNISGLTNLNKIFEKLIISLVVSDMKDQLDPSQYANQKGLSIQHYLVKFIDRILSSLDKAKGSNSKAVIATLVDWKQAFPRQCPKLGVKSFIENGVRPSLIPIIISFFQDRKMRVKWKGLLSKVRDLNGGGPQGSSLGIWEYLSQSNDNADFVDIEDRFKFVDDLSFLEVVSLLKVGLASHNSRINVPSNVAEHNQIVPSAHLKTMEHLENISSWTQSKKMKLNEKKTKSLIFNFTKKYQFTTRLSVNDVELDVPKEAKLLGTIITDNLKWDRNTEELVKKASKRMQLRFRASKFTTSRKDLKDIYVTFVRSILENSSVVWHSSLTKNNSRALERILKMAVKVIMGSHYQTYKKSLKTLEDNLETKREKLCLGFAKKCVQHEKLKH